MKRIVIFLLMVAANYQLFSQCADTSNIYTFIYNGKTYEIVKELKTWSQAAACAVERGGYLVEINDSNENNAIFNAIINGAGISTTYTYAVDGGGTAYIWIGANDLQTEGNWMWDGNNDNSGTQFWTGQGVAGNGGGTAVGNAYNNWGGTSTGTANEPDNFDGSQDNAAIALAGWPAGTTILGIGSEWNDINGSNQLYYIIEKNPSSIKSSSQNNEHIKIYPNPASHILHVTGTYQYAQLFDVNGKCMQTYRQGETIDVSSFADTMYFMRIVGDDFVYTEKIVVK